MAFRFPAYKVAEYVLVCCVFPCKHNRRILCGGYRLRYVCRGGCVQSFRAAVNRLLRSLVFLLALGAHIDFFCYRFCLYRNFCHGNRAVFYAFFYRKSLYLSVLAECQRLAVFEAFGAFVNCVIDCGSFRLCCHRHLYTGISCVLRGKCYCLGVNLINILGLSFRFAAKDCKSHCHCREHGKNPCFFHFFLLKLIYLK